MIGEGWRAAFREWCRPFAPDMHYRDYGWDRDHYLALKKGFRAGWKWRVRSARGPDA